MVSLIAHVLAAALATVPQPQPLPPLPAPAPEVSTFALRVGLGFGRYRESAPGLVFESDLQPQVRVGAEARLPTRGVVVIPHASATVGTDVHIDARQNGDVVQENRFHQQLFEGGLRLRWVFGSFELGVGYALTVQRLFFTDIPGFGDALETVLVHAVEVGVGWRWEYASGDLRLDLLGAMNRGSAENDRVEGEDFSAGGISYGARLRRAWASGFTIEGEVASRKQHGTRPEPVTIDGQATDAFWPDNRTWGVFFATGYAF